MRIRLLITLIGLLCGIVTSPAQAADITGAFGYSLGKVYLMKQPYVPPFVEADLTQLERNTLFDSYTVFLTWGTKRAYEIRASSKPIDEWLSAMNTAKELIQTIEEKYGKSSRGMEVVKSSPQNSEFTTFWTIKQKHSSLRLEVIRGAAKKWFITICYNSPELAQESAEEQWRAIQAGKKKGL